MIILFWKKILVKEIFLLLFIEYTVSVEYKKASEKAQKPLHLTSGSVGSDLFSEKNTPCMLCNLCWLILIYT